MSESAKRARRLLALAAIGLAAAGLTFALWTNRRPTASDDTVRMAPLPPYSETKYRLAGLDAVHIGSAACASCHPNNHKSYLLTAHSRRWPTWTLQPNRRTARSTTHHPAARTGSTVRTASCATRKC